jgi:alpha-beta hydrolase superfamily lysophospholipase
MKQDILRPFFSTKAILISLLVITASLFVPNKATARQLPWPDSAEVTVMTPDSLELVGDLYWPKSTKVTKLPLVILLHQKAETHGAWRHLDDVLCADDFAVFAMDLRGYGYSIYDFRTGQNRPPNTFYVGEQARYPADIRQLVRKVFAEHGKMLDSTRIAVVGAELGGNAGLLYAVDEPNVRFTALISPGLEYSGLQIGKAIKDYGERPLFMATAKLDIYSMESLNLLSDVVPRVLDAVVFDTFRYGNELVDTEPQLAQMLIERLRQYLK